MERIVELIGIPLQALMRLCYDLLKNYTFAIIVFTLLTKIILLPVSLWTHRNGIKMVELMPELNRAKIKYYGDKEAIAEETQRLYKEYHYHPLLSTIPMIIQIVLLMGVVGAVKALLGESNSALTLIPAQDGGWTWLMPLAAGLAALTLSYAQSKISPLQREQSVREQVITGGISVAISLFLGIYVMVGVAIYWIAGNLLSIAQQFLLNWLIKPEKYVDYPALEESKRELAEIEALTPKVSPEDKKREKEDYKRFFSVANKHLVFYSEKSGFYKYYEDLIDELLKRSNLIIHYVTSDPKDQVFELAKTKSRIKPYYIGEKRLITLFMKMDADIVVMTTPDLDNYYLKRSYIRKDIEYIYVSHGMGSSHTELRAGALDHFDTLFLDLKQNEEEVRGWEKAKGLPAKRLVEYGYPLLDHLLRDYVEMQISEKKNDKPKIVIAPSWQTDNIMDSCIEDILDHLVGFGYQIIVRPHPQYVRHFGGKLQAMEMRYKDLGDEVTFDTSFSSFEDVYTADLLMTDWSGVAFEFSFTTCRPTLFIHTPMKIMNPEYKLVPVKSFQERMRNLIGVDLMPEELDKLHDTVEELLKKKNEYYQLIDRVRREERYNYGCAAPVGAQDIINRLKEKQRELKNEKTEKT